MALGVLSYTCVSNLGKEYKETLGEIDLDLTDESTRLTNAQKLDTLCRAVNDLTYNVYKDAEVVTTESINEIIAEGAAGA